MLKVLLAKMTNFGRAAFGTICVCFYIHNSHTVSLGSSSLLLIN